MANNTVLGDSWPPDLDPRTVPFKGRTVTVLERAGVFDDWSRFDELTEVEVAGWWNAGPVTVDDLRATGDAAIRRHHAEAQLRPKIARDLHAVARERWSNHVWRNDPRFGSLVPAGGTVYWIAKEGSSKARRQLWDSLEGHTCDGCYTGQARSDCRCGAVYGGDNRQHENRLEVLLARTGLDGQAPITAVEAGDRVGVSHQRIGQIVEQLHYHDDRAAPPRAVWMPQLDAAMGSGWPDGYSEVGVASTVVFFSR